MESQDKLLGGGEESSRKGQVTAWTNINRGRFGSHHVPTNVENDALVNRPQGIVKQGEDEKDLGKPSIESIQKSKDWNKLSERVFVCCTKPLRIHTEVYEGWMKQDSGEMQEVAVKLLKKTNKCTREVDILTNLADHPHVVKILEWGSLVNVLVPHIYIAMELCLQNLNEYIKGNHFQLPKAISFFQQIISAIVFIHNNHIAHRDLKPSNILITLDGNNVKVSDFGISRELADGHNDVTVTYAGAGTPGFRSPETHGTDCKISLEVDIFTLAISGFFMLTHGKHPFGPDSCKWDANIRDSQGLDLSQISDFPEPNVHKRQQLIDLFTYMLNPNPESRPTALRVSEDVFFEGFDGIDIADPEAVDEHDGDLNLSSKLLKEGPSGSGADEAVYASEDYAGATLGAGKPGDGKAIGQIEWEHEQEQGKDEQTGTAFNVDVATYNSNLPTVEEFMNSRTEDSYEAYGSFGESLFIDESDIEENDGFEEIIELSKTLIMFPQKKLANHRKVVAGEISNDLGIRPCVIKFDPDQIVKEMNALRKLGSHSNIVGLIGYGTYSSWMLDISYIVLEKCHQLNLESFVLSESTVPVYDIDQGFKFCKQIINGMKYIHSQLIIHKDLKPSNILLTLDLENAKIADFGSSQKVKSLSSMVPCRFTFGTLGYRPPESLDRSYASLKSDIFSLGVVFCFLLSKGESPFGPHSDEWDHNTLTGVVDLSCLLVTNPLATTHLIMSMLNMERRSRPSMHQIEHHLCWIREEHALDYNYAFEDETDDSVTKKDSRPKERFNGSASTFLRVISKFEKLLREEYGWGEKKDSAEVTQAAVESGSSIVNDLSNETTEATGVAGDNEPTQKELPNGDNGLELTEFRIVGQSKQIRIGQVIGRGAGSLVYEGRFQSRRVAVKSLLYEGNSKEVKILEGLEHKNVIRIHCTDTQDATLYIALDLCKYTLQEVSKSQLM